MNVGIYQCFIIHIFVLFYGIVARQVQMNGNITDNMGTHDTQLICNFTLDEGDVLDSVWILATNITYNDFENVAIFEENFGSRLVPFGKVLFGNASLSHFGKSVKNVSISFDDLNCKHSRLYKCKIMVIRLITQPTAESEAIGISVQVPPSKPDDILLVHTPVDSLVPTTKQIDYGSSLPSPAFTSNEYETESVSTTEKQNATNHTTTTPTPSTEGVPSTTSHRTATYSTRQTTAPQGIVEGDNITVVCTGDVGKPPANYVFKKYLHRDMVPMRDTFTSTSLFELSENCSYYRTSNLTFQVTARDNNAVIRCMVNSSMEEPDMFIDMDPLKVYYDVSMPTIIMYPNKPYYVVDEDTSIHLTCKSEGNPKPVYQWYKGNHIESISKSANLTITDINVTNSGLYTCKVSNFFNGYTYKNATSVQIDIMNKDDIPTTQSSSTGSSSGVDKKGEKSNGDLGLVVGIVVAVVTVIIVVVVVIACMRRKSKSPTSKNVSKSFDDSKPKPGTEPRTGDYDYIALEDDAPKTKSSKNGLEVEDINKHNKEYLQKQEEEEKKKNESNTPPQPAVYAQVNEASKLKNKQKTETPEKPDKQEEDPYAETQEDVYDEAGNPRHKENKNAEKFDVSTNSSKHKSNDDNKLSIQTSQVGSYANQGFEKDENRKVATVSPTVRSSSGSQNDEQTNLNRNNQSKKKYENIIGTDQTGKLEEESSHRTAL